MLGFITYFSLLSGLGYYLWPQTAGSFVVVSLLALGLALRWPFGGTPRALSLLGGLLGGGVLSWWGLSLADQATTLAARGPWALVPMVATVLVPASLVAVGLYGRRAELVVLAIGASAFITAVLFPIGFGFDPFVHEATINHLLAYGELSPKQPYYAAFYGLAQGVIHILNVPLHQLLRFGLPILFTFTAWWSADRVKSVTSLALALSLLFLPLMIVTQSTPYALGTIFLMLTVLTTWQNDSHRVSWSLAAAALLTHPIPGILAVAVTLCRARTIIFKILGPVLALAGVPLMFFGLALLTEVNTPTLHAPALATLFPFFTNGTYQAWPDLIYFIGANRWWWGVGLGLAGLLVTTRDRERLGWAHLSLAANLSAVLLASGFSFNTLPAHEQLDYALRLKELSLILAWPLMATASQSLLEKLSSRGERATLAALSGVLAASMMIAMYPRHDAYARFGGLTASQADLDTIHLLETEAEGAPYAVLANQAMSALALREFGFVGRYVGAAGDVFFYPIPTGSPLGLLTTDILQVAPTGDRLEQAFNLTKTPIIYLVIHDYWARSETLKAQAATLGGQPIEAPAGLSVFRFDQPLNQ